MSGSAWSRRRTAEPSKPADSMTEEEILAAPEAHSMEAHGDNQFHADCVECRVHGRKILALFNLTPQQYLDSFDWHHRGSEHNLLYRIAKVCAEEEDDDGE